MPAATTKPTNPHAQSHRERCAQIAFISSSSEFGDI
jgi:hypothetical protein